VTEATPFGGRIRSASAAALAVTGSTPRLVTEARRRHSAPARRAASHPRAWLFDRLRRGPSSEARIAVPPPAPSGTSALDHLARRDRGRTGVPWCRSASVASGTRIVACRDLGLVGQRVALPPGSQPYGDSDYARNDEPRPQRPERARPPGERQHLAKGYHDEDPRALGESLHGIHAHTYCRHARGRGQLDWMIGPASGRPAGGRPLPGGARTGSSAHPPSGTI
jgi:hypothetical protein